MNNLEDKFKLYIKEVVAVQDKYGFIYSDECDSLLFSGLLGSVPGTAVFINAAFEAYSGQWHRRPLNLPACYPDHSKSTISRDMLTGLAYYAYFNNRLDISEQVIKYALKHFGFMGKGALSRINIMPPLLSTFAWISYKLGGPSRPWLRFIPTFASKNTTDYQAHLAVLHAYLRDQVVGKSTKNHQKLYEYQADRNPANALFQIAANRVDKAYTILSNEQFFPSNRLPNTLDRKGSWLWERDFGSNYAPGQTSKVLSGGDFLFAYWLLNDYLQNNKQDKQ